MSSIYFSCHYYLRDEYGIFVYWYIVNNGQGNTRRNIWKATNNLSRMMVEKKTLKTHARKKIKTKQRNVGNQSKQQRI